MKPIDVSGKKGLIVGIANDHSIAWGCAKRLFEGGAQLAITYASDKAKPYVEPLAQSVEASIFAPLDVTEPLQLDQLFAVLAERWGELDFIIHSIAFAPKQDLSGRVVDCSREGFLMAMDISCHSFMELARRAEPLLNKNASLLTMSYFGAQKVVPNYSIMGPVKAALECAVQYMAMELGPKGIRVNAISPGTIATRAAGGIPHFDQLLKQNVDSNPLHYQITIEDIGDMAAFLVSDGAKAVTGGIHYVDAGYQIID